MLRPSRTRPPVPGPPMSEHGSGQPSTQQSEPGVFRGGSPGFSQGRMHAGQWRSRPPPPHGPAMAWGVSCELSDSGMWEDHRAEAWVALVDHQVSFETPHCPKRCESHVLGSCLGVSDMRRGWGGRASIGWLAHPEPWEPSAHRLVKARPLFVLRNPLSSLTAEGCCETSVCCPYGRSTCVLV